MVGTSSEIEYPTVGFLSVVSLSWYNVSYDVNQDILQLSPLLRQHYQLTGHVDVLFFDCYIGPYRLCKRICLVTKYEAMIRLDRSLRP